MSNERMIRLAPIAALLLVAPVAEATRKYVESEYVLAKTLLRDLGLGK